MDRKRDAKASVSGDVPAGLVLPIREGAAADAVARFLDQALAERDLVDRMQMVATCALAASDSPAMRSALEAEATGRGRLRRRAIALFALADKAPRVVARLRDGELVRLVLGRQVIAWEQAMMETDGPSRGTRERFVERPVEEQIALIEALTESEALLLPGTAAFLHWLATHARDKLVRSEVAAILAEEEGRDWPGVALVALQAANLEQAGRAYEMADSGGSEGRYDLQRGLCLGAAGDLDEAAEALERFLSHAPAYPFADAVRATAASLRLRERTAEDDGDDSPFPIALPFLVNDPVAAMLGRDGLSIDAMVHRATWGLGLVALGERLGDGACSAGSWARAVEWVVQYLREREDAVAAIPAKAVRSLPPAVRSCATRLVTALGLDRSAPWLVTLWQDLETMAEEMEQARQGYEIDDKGSSRASDEVAATGLDTGRLEKAFFATLPEDERTPQRGLVVSVAERCWADEGVDPSRVDEEAVCEALARYAVAQGFKAGADEAASDAQIAVDTAVRLAAFLSATQGARVDSGRLAAHGEELTRLIARLIAANAAAIAEMDHGDDARNVADELSDLDGLIVEQVKPGRVWVRQVESRKTGVIATHAGLDRHVAPGDVIIGALAKGPTGRYVITTVDGVKAVPDFVVRRPGMR